MSWNVLRVFVLAITIGFMGLLAVEIIAETCYFILWHTEQKIENMNHCGSKCK
jgi:hypothetical protein